jgi:membrane protein
VYVWLASSGVHALFDAFESMSGTSRGWVHKRAVALLSCLGLSLGGAALAVLTGAVQRVRSLIDASVSAPDGMELLVRALLGAALVFAIAGCLYAVGVPTHTRQRLPIVPGAALATVLQAALVVAYGALVRVTGDGSAYLAGLSAIAATMTSVYLHVLALLLGFALNQGWSQSRAWSRLGHVAAQPLHDRAT